MTNYQADTIQVSGKLMAQGDTILAASSEVADFRTDRFTLKVKGQNADTLKATYQIQYDDMIDGEVRAVPIRRVGVSVSDGIFGEVFRDSTYRFTMKDTLTISAYHNPIRLLRSSYYSLTQYVYNCNEQMASKLLGWFGYKKASDAMNKETPEYRAKVKSLIKKLMKNQNDEGLWAWWGKGKTNWWISNHVIRALLAAEENGFEVFKDKAQMEVSLKKYLQTGSQGVRLDALEMLEMLGNKEIAFGSFVDSLNQASLTLNQELRLIAIAQKRMLPNKLDSIMDLAVTDRFGGLRLGEEHRFIADNASINSALLLSILAENNLHMDKQRQLVSYLMRRRKVEGWRNTYENSIILGELMRFFTNQYSAESPALQLTVNGSTRTITEFPFEQKMAGGDFELQNTGGGQLFFTAYQEYWDPRPARNDSLIQVASAFLDTAGLQMGKPVTLRVGINTDERLDYVMVSIPIPAGCSFTDKTPYLKGAAYTEYLYDRVNLYFERLYVGEKVLDIRLTPRFEGNFQLNPAKVELMYFPTYFGHEAQKEVPIINR